MRGAGHLERGIVILSLLASLSVLSASLWLGLLLFRGGFWRADQHLGHKSEFTDGAWPAVAVVIPARNEAAGIGRAVTSHLGQDYPGLVRVFVIDDNSDDGTAEAAGMAAGDDNRLTVIPGKALESGWTGKLWAVSQGIERVREEMSDAEYLLLTDGDIEHGPENLGRLVSKARQDNLLLTSLMVKLRCNTSWERLLIPAFVFFFQKLFPFPWVNNPHQNLAAAAGGCMLVNFAALEDAGGVSRIRDQVIDDCALAALLKPRGPIWLGLTDNAHSLRPYDKLGEIWDMVTRTAYVQLKHSPSALIGSVLGMILIYVLPVAGLILGLLTGDTPAVAAASTAWMMMAITYLPTLRLYKEPLWRALLLPIAASFYTLMTLDSARRHYAGQGGTWKGRNYDVPEPPANHP